MAMDPKILSLQEFADEPQTDLNATDPARGHSVQLLGGLLATSPETRTRRKRRLASTKAQQRSQRRVSSDSISGGDEVGGAPQRGRPRLDASNQTRGEV